MPSDEKPRVDPFEGRTPSGNHQVVEVRLTSQSSEPLASVHDVHEATKAAGFSVSKAATEVLRGVFSRNALLLLLVLGGAAASTLWGVKAFGQSVAEKVDAGQAAQDTLIAAEQSARRDLAARYEQHVIDSGRTHERLERKLDEVQMDIRAMREDIRAAQKGQPLPPLPPPAPSKDGGTP